MALLLEGNVYSAGYIHGKPEDVRWSSVNLALSKQDSKITSLLSRYMDQMKSQIHLTDASTNNIIDLETLGPQTLASLMDQIAIIMNEEVSKELPQLNTVMTNAFNGIYSNVNFMNDNGSINSDRFNTMMESIFKALELVTRGQLTREQWTTFTYLYRRLFSRTVSSSTIGTLVSSWDLKYGAETVKRVVDLLRDIPSNLIDKQGKFTQSIRGSMTHVTRTIKKYLEEVAADSAIDASQKVDMILTSNGFVKTGNQPARNKNITTAQSTIYSFNGLSITAKVAKTNAGQYMIESSVNGDIQWPIMNGAQSITAINPFTKEIKIANYNNIVKQIEALYSNPSGRYGAYNTLVWRNANATAASNYQIFKTSIMQNSLEMFLSGRNSTPIDLASFLLINGTFYSVAGIIYIIEQEIKRKAASDIILIELQGEERVDNENKWRDSKEDAPNVMKALKRHNAIKRALNKMGFSVTLNGPALQRKLSNPVFNPAKLTI